MSMEPIIERLIGRAEAGEAGSLTPEEGRALSQRLRALVDGDPASTGPDRGPAEEALRLAAYLDGTLDAAARADFERELVHSPERRDELIAAVAWLDQLAARREAPPADALQRAMALDTPPPQPRGRGFAAVVEWLLPRPRLAIATSALATLAIAAVGVDIALHLSPLATRPPAIGETLEPPPIRTHLPPPSTIRPLPQGRILLTAETINAVLAYQEQPAEQRRLDLIGALARAGSPAFDARNVRVITVQPRLLERLRQRNERLPAEIAASLSLDGNLRLESAD